MKVITMKRRAEKEEMEKKYIYTFNQVFKIRMPNSTVNTRRRLPSAT